MKVLFYNFYPLDSNGMPGLLDEALEYLQDPENAVLFVTCSGETKPCDSNPEESRIRCWECMLSSRLLLSKLKHPNFTHKTLGEFLSDEARRRVKSTVFQYDAIEDVKEIAYRDNNIGLGVVSSYVSMTRNLNPALTTLNRRYFDHALRASAYLTEATLEMVHRFAPDVVCLVNGRFGGMRPVMEVSLSKKVSTSILEFTFSSSRRQQNKMKYLDAMPHDIDNTARIIEDAWDNWCKSVDKEKVAASFYEKRRKGETASDHVYISGQDRELLPANWDSSKRNFVIFNSSEDEFFCIGDAFDKYKIFPSQIDGILHLVQQASQDPSIHFYLRIHPNLKRIKFKYHTGLADLFKDYPNITVIPAASPVSTYKLIDACEKVFVFGSTAGVEAAYWGKPVVLLGGAYYLYLDVAYYPKHLSEVDALIHQPLEPKPRLGALKYALYIFGELGTPYQYMNYNCKEIKIRSKTLLLPLCYEYKGSMLPYLSLVIFFRLVNLLPHLYFKKVTMQALCAEN
ncbi:capsular polysaccharide export protein, LipB/KpsS family [Geomesophilobacter sediminis]|uniref:Capsule biosynthesis protein n=1 Tax=Geomesophilobacter sediminis TaxID=2798584 RepID=A0A8J7IMU7_9BACT|nr:hypothetical protein [Geomesophilobacter sediminis]MBJ6723169.1 hypothetical protein [Geomesophilobacter sediminis]